MLMEKRLAGVERGGGVIKQAAKLEGFVGECVRERAVKRKEVLEKKSTPALSNKSSSYAG